MRIMRTIASLLAATFLSLGIASAATLRVVEATNQIVPKDFTTITLQLVDWVQGREQPVPIRRFDAVVLSAGDGDRDLTKYFSLRSDGSLSAGDQMEFAEEILAAERPLALQFRGVDANGTPRTLWADFWLGTPPKPSISQPGKMYYRGSDGAWHAEDEDRRQKINSFWFQLVDGLFHPVLVQDITWPEPLDDLTERQLQAMRRRGRAAPNTKFIAVLAYDGQGNVIYRTRTWIAFSMEVCVIGSGTRTYAVPKPGFSVYVPLGASRIELIPWQGQPGATFDVQTLTSDPRLRTDELLRQ